MECRDDNYSGTWQAGFAKVDITPPIGVWLMGFGARLHGATGMHDPLYATALVLCMGAEKIAIVVDLDPFTGCYSY
jgi:phosphotransferase system  glucose/maltose/N-acetylglucosamine-specific IIC component